MPQQKQKPHNTMWGKMKANLWQNDPAKASSKAIIWEKKWKETKANLSQNDPAKPSSKAVIWETNEKT